ncbi:hypothetical protein Pyn_17703 [Prunus yedoensis var. nudiflora]|uniref:Uncharacterized protein n=1 Tax=Prunus yedoensis var. nudiflora TaxID=2094558 RepID=A0A314Z6S5_PRUYE|nr:hypothetical protein Pyn_17703 [Prunus yedoensis var. nudiflora]
MAEAEDDHKIVMEADSRALVDGLKGNLAHEAARIGARAAGVDHWASRPPCLLFEFLQFDGLPCRPVM